MEEVPKMDLNSYFKVNDLTQKKEDPTSFARKTINVDILKNYFKQPKSVPKKRHTFGYPQRSHQGTHSNIPKNSDIRYIETITSNDFKSNNLGNKIFSPDIRNKQNSPTFIRGNVNDKFDSRRTVPSKRNVSNFDPMTSLHYQNQLGDISDNKNWMDTGVDHTLFEVTSGPEVRVDLASDRPNKIYQFENQYVKNVSSLKNSSVLMRGNKPTAIQTQNNFRKTPYKKMFSPTNNISNKQLNLFSRTTPNGFKIKNSNMQILNDAGSSLSRRNPQSRHGRSISLHKSRSRNQTVSSYDNPSLSREIKKASSSLPKSVRFLDSIITSGDKLNSKTNIKSILKNSSPRNLTHNLNRRPNKMRNSSGVYSNSPRIKKMIARGSKPRIRDIGKKILNINRNVSRISERNESSKMNESKSSIPKTSSRFRTVISPNVIQKVTQSPAKVKVQGKVVVLNDSRLSDSFRKISGNALISRSVQRIRKERLSRRISPQITGAKVSTPTSMLSSSGRISKPSHFANSKNKENVKRNKYVSDNPFKNTIYTPKNEGFIEFRQSFGIQNKPQVSKRVLQSGTTNKVILNKKPNPSTFKSNRVPINKKYLSKLKNKYSNRIKNSRDSW
jgi:hypothetical protein